MASSEIPTTARGAHGFCSGAGVGTMRASEGANVTSSEIPTTARGAHGFCSGAGVRNDADKGGREYSVERDSRGEGQSSGGRANAKPGGRFLVGERTSRDGRIAPKNGTRGGLCHQAGSPRRLGPTRTTTQAWRQQVPRGAMS